MEEEVQRRESPASYHIIVSDGVIISQPQRIPQSMNV
jgi:hypothetical protein